MHLAARTYLNCVPRVSSFELPISASHIHLLRVLSLVGCRSKTPTGIQMREDAAEQYLSYKLIDSN
jgi:hypothetical protein